MIKDIAIKLKTGNKTVYEYTHYAFKTGQGIFTLCGSDTNGTDTFKNLKTGTYHEWNRKQIWEWLQQGLIETVEEATSLDWHLRCKW